MSVVLVAGGLGDLGRPITDALFESDKYEVYITSRKQQQQALDASGGNISSPLTGKAYNPVLQTDYASEDALASMLEQHEVAVVICALPMDSDAACDAQLRLIRASERCACVKRFVPSEFNVEYDAGDDTLPYPEKRFHQRARRELEKTRTLEYAYVYPGMFMDYFGLPAVPSSLRPLAFCVDPQAALAVLPGDGEGRMSMCTTTDMARYLVAALELEEWPATSRVMTAIASTVSMNQLVAIHERVMGKKFEVRLQPVEKLVRHEAEFDLPINVEIAREYADRFPQGIRGIVADLEASVALGGYDVDKFLGGGAHLDLVKLFEGKLAPPKTIEELIQEAWKPR